VATDKALAPPSLVLGGGTVERRRRAGDGHRSLPPRGTIVVATTHFDALKTCASTTQA
jgi:hypothetical protein